MDGSCDHLDPDSAEHPTTPDEDSPGDDAAGDIEMIRWMLSLTPSQRLQVLQDFVDTFWTPQHG
jgi:hypothetical protein